MNDKTRTPEEIRDMIEGYQRIVKELESDAKNAKGELEFDVLFNQKQRYECRIESLKWVLNE